MHPLLIFIRSHTIALSLTLMILLMGVFIVLKSTEHPRIPDIPLPEHPGQGLTDNGFGPIETVTPKETPPTPPSMERMKRQGCIADGFLSDYGENAGSTAKLISRSNCYYLHRSLETWLRPPDFELAQKIKARVTKPDIVYGMFIAEAIDTKADYFYPPEQRDFEFAKMCRDGSKNKWGEHTCQPSFEKREYMLYVQYITKQAMDMGIQSFMFGQVFLQDANDPDRSLLNAVMSSMRGYAQSKGMQIVIGAQTNDIEDESYLRMFDYIEGGVGLHADGSIEDGPCFSRWWKKEGDWCWALLWHNKFASKANNVFIHLDWSGRSGDDMSTFARMSQNDRAKAMKKLHKYFTSRDIGFFLPFLAPLPAENGSCYGPKKRFYSPDNKYTCQDEDALNTVLSNDQ
ncbi:MAG: hypothetical protein PHT88_03120 [Candidatus Moranbacteria bacterium]|nr:hypothetical protein [Candidatus Moranbacteria bacterium]